MTGKKKRLVTTEPAMCEFQPGALQMGRARSRRWSVMASLAELILFRDQHGLLLLVVVSGMASQAGEASLGVLLARIDFVAGRANGSNGFWPRVCESAGLFPVPHRRLGCAPPPASPPH